MKLGEGGKAAAAHLVVPADDELQVAHELPEGLVLGEQALGAVGNLLLLLEVQVLDLSQNRHQLRPRESTDAIGGWPQLAAQGRVWP